MRNIGYIVFPGFGVMSFAAISVFETANTMAGIAYYDVNLLSEAGGPVKSSIGVVVETKAFKGVELDTLIIGGGGDMPFTAGLRDFLIKAAATTRRIAGTCTGAFFLADAGILDGKRATTHWFFADDFAERFPHVQLDPDSLFVVDGAVWTSAGMSAGIDQALAMVEEDLGVEISRRVAKDMILPNRRAGGLSQSSAMLEIRARSSRVQEALAYAQAHIGEPLTTERLAAVAKLSERQFNRVFRQETGMTPAKAIEKLRIEAARLQVQHGARSIDEIARDTGFHDRERMRRVFVRAYGAPPQRIRRSNKAP